jgi:hypothetical protein
MVRFGVTRLRLALLAILVAFCGGGSRIVDARVWTVAGPAQPPRTVEAATLLAALPASLTPQLDPGLRLVALVASDIDDDGDLDLVANDGSLDLLVWINDGTGHLTRRLARRTSGWRDDASTANSDKDGAAVSAVVSSIASIDPDQSPALHLANAGEPGLGYLQPSLDALFARSQSPRAPPLPRRSI